MIRFIHAADLHIDSPLRGLGRYAGAPVERLRNATRRALVQLVDLALREQVHFVLLAGDLYDRDWPDFHTGLFFREQMVRLVRAGTAVFVVQGNHDAQGVISRQLPLPEQVKVFGSRAAETVLLRELGVALHGRSFPDRAVDEDFVPNYPEPVPGVFNIGLLHTSLTGAAGHDTYAPTSLPVLRAKGYDYWALGHVHARQVVSEAAPRVVFPGNLQGRHANETGAKGCELVTVHGGAVDAVFVPLDVVRWHQCTVPLDGIDQLGAATQRVARALADAAEEGAGGDRLHAMRIHLVGQTALQAEEARQPGTLAAMVHAAAQDVPGAEVWIEQVRLAVSSPVDRARIAQGQDAVAELVRLVDELAADPARLADWSARMLGDVLHKLPAEVLAGQAGDLPVLADPESLRGLLMEAEATLLARLNANPA
ncbi:metallophosphoesterase family protein [Rhodoferax koreense]|uniref:metallophosphoesterase family protein n=1 Tax=Rhodoferax koreensis TaxID=1842727 RepID=UPI001EF6EA32|nr:DNA repair exonuclease [Rhodoferax koreense]